jgi:hypothetical protein
VCDRPFVPTCRSRSRAAFRPWREPHEQNGRRDALSANTSPGLSGRTSGRALPSLTLAGVTATALDECRLGVRPDMCLESCTVALPLCLTQRASPSLAEAMIVESTRVPVFTVIALVLNWRVTISNGLYPNRARPAPCAATRRLFVPVSSPTLQNHKTAGKKRDHPKLPQASYPRDHTKPRSKSP